MRKLLENHSRMSFRELTFNSNSVKYFCIWRKNLNAIQDFVTGSCETFFLSFSAAKKFSQHFVELCILTQTNNREIMQNFTFMEISNWKIFNISIPKNWGVRVMLWTCSHFNIDSVICKVFHAWITEVIDMKKPHFYNPKQFRHIWIFLQLLKKRSYELGKVFLVWGIFK